MDPTSCPPIDCQTFCPSRMVSPLNNNVPSAVTTLPGIGGAFLIPLYPTPPSTPNETTRITAKVIQSFLNCMTFTLFKAADAARLKLMRVRLLPAQRRARADEECCS